MDIPSTSRQSSYRNHRKLSDYCNIFAEKTNRIGRNVESFIHSRGFFMGRRSNDDTSHNTIIHRNGDVIRNDYYRFTNSHETIDAREEDHHRYRAERNRHDRLSSYSKNIYSHERSGAETTSYVDRDMEMQSRRLRQQDYTYVDRNSWRDGFSELNSKPLLRNGVSHGRGERLYSSTLPRRSRTINFRDPNSLEYRRGYPKSLQDLSDLELDDRIREPNVGSLLSSQRREWRSDRMVDDAYRRRRYREDQLEDDYLRLYRSLSRLNKYPQGGKFEPGQVHYERECRTFGKDTVAFIYYKTCYL